LFVCYSRRRHTRSKRDWSSDVCSSDLLALGWNKVFVGGDILFYNGCPAFKTGLSQTLQHYRGVLDSLAQQTVQQAGITAEFCDRMFTAFGAPRQILEAVFLESAQSATRYAGSSF